MDLGCGIWDLGFGIWDLGFGIWDLGLGSESWDLELEIWIADSVHCRFEFRIPDEPWPSFIPRSQIPIPKSPRRPFALLLPPSRYQLVPPFRSRLALH